MGTSDRNAGDWVCRMPGELTIQELFALTMSGMLPEAPAITGVPIACAHRIILRRFPRRCHPRLESQGAKVIELVLNDARFHSVAKSQESLHALELLDCGRFLARLRSGPSPIISSRKFGWQHG